MTPGLVVWDFDGVLNQNVVDGRFIWADTLEPDLGLSPESLQSFLFRSGRMQGVVRGSEDLWKVVSEWLEAEGARLSADAFLAYWFEKDALPDTEVVAWMAALNTRHVIGTNNEARRAAYIEGPMGFSRRVERVFASGRLGVGKPDDGFFEAIENWSAVPKASTLLVDDSAANVAAALRRGWQAYHFTSATRAGLPAVLGLR
ncbi:MAG: HAD-IA family hydrolase [Pseudomonadota bacterium]